MVMAPVQIFDRHLMVGEMADLARCCVFFSLRVLALVSPSFQVSFLQPGKVFSSGAAVHGPGGIPPIGSMLVPLPGGLIPRQ